MPQQLQDLTVDRVSLVDRAAVRDPQSKSEPRRFLVWKREGAVEPQSDKENHMPDTMTAEETQAALEKAQADLAASEEQVTKLEAKPPKDEDDDSDEDAGGTDGKDSKKAEINKDELTPEVRAYLEKADEDRETLRKRVEASEGIAKGERDLRLDREFLAKAETFTALPVAPSEFGPVLKRAAEHLSEPDVAYLDTLFKAANEQIAKGELFKERGSSIASSGAAGDAFEQLTRKAEDLRKAEPRLSPEDALDKAMNDPANRDLQEQYLAETRV